jgi:hypothetical protein
MHTTSNIDTGPAGATCGNAVSLDWSAYLSGEEGLNGTPARASLI